jgi:Domain of unknown function (DUF5710)
VAADLWEPTDRIWLAVPFEDKDAARRLGARWDGKRRQWYAPLSGSPLLERWAELPEDLPGEDRTFGAGLFVDLIPSTSWFANVRSAVSPTDWYRIRTMVYSRAGNRCETCGRAADPEAGLRLEAHERFKYAGNVQRLRRLLCLCSACHATTHMGLAGIRGEGEPALGHLMAVTGMTRAQAGEHVREAFRVWEKRSRIQWVVDVRMIECENVEMTARPTGGLETCAAPGSVRVREHY